MKSRRAIPAQFRFKIFIGSSLFYPVASVIENKFRRVNERPGQVLDRCLTGGAFGRECPACDAQLLLVRRAAVGGEVELFDQFACGPLAFGELSDPAFSTRDFRLQSV